MSSPEVGQRIAQRADLPVEDGPHGAIVGQDHVVHPVIAVHDGRPLLLGDAPGQLVAHALDDAAVVDTLDLHLLVLPAPALELPLDVPLVPTQIAQSDRIGVDGVQRSQRVRHVTADGHFGSPRRMRPRPRVRCAGCDPRRTPSRRRAVR
jgi:hypothetical protein